MRDVILAAVFGVGAHADVYSSAFRVPNLLQVLLGDQTLSATFIPGYSRLLGQGRAEDAGRFAGAIFGLLLATASVLVLLGLLGAEAIVALFTPGYLGDAAKVAAGEASVDRFPLAVAAVRIVFPMAGILVLSAWCLGILNSHRRFFLPYFAPVVWNASIIAAVLWAVSEDSGPERLLLAACWGALAGGVLQFGIQLPLVMRLLKGFRLTLSARMPEVKTALRAMVPVISARGVVHLSGWLDLVLASLILPGAQAALRFAQPLYLLPISLFSMSVSAAELPTLSRLGEKEPEKLGRRIDAGCRKMVFLTAPTVVGYLLLGRPLVAAIYQRGEFGIDSTFLVSLVLAAYCVGIFPSSLSRLFQNTFYALSDTRTPARFAVIRVTVSAGVGAALMAWLDRFPVEPVLSLPKGTSMLHLGAVGLALGATVAGWVELVLLIRALKRRLANFRIPLRSFGRFFAVSGLAYFPAALLLAFLPESRAVLRGVLVLGCYGATYLGICAVLRFPELREWISVGPGRDGKEDQVEEDGN